MILLAFIGFTALYFLHGIRAAAERGADATAEAAWELKRMNDAKAKGVERARHDAAHRKGRAP